MNISLLSCCILPLLVSGDSKSDIVQKTLDSGSGASGGGLTPVQQNYILMFMIYLIVVIVIVIILRIIRRFIKQRRNTQPQDVDLRERRQTIVSDTSRVGEDASASVSPPPPLYRKDTPPDHIKIDIENTSSTINPIDDIPPPPFTATIV